MSSTPPSVPLFRAEALAEQQHQFLGVVRLATSPRRVAVAWVAAIVAAALVAFAALGQATRKVQVPGVLMPRGGLLQLSTPQPARLLELRVGEGVQVEPGQVLAVLQLSGSTERGDTAQLLHASLRARREALDAEIRGLQAQAHQREHALRDRHRSLQLDLTQAEGEQEATARRVQLLQASLRRDQGLADLGFLSTAQVQSRQEELLDLQVRERTVRRGVEGLRREMAGVLAELQAGRLQVSTQQAQLDRAVATLAQEETELQARSLLHLTAPARATVGVLSAPVGQSVQAGQTVLSLQPLEHEGPPGPSLQAELYAPSRTSGFIEAGQSVWIRLHAYPYQKFGMVPGRVAEVSRTPVLPQDLPSGMAQALLTAAQAQEPLYRITVTLPLDSLQAYGRAQALKPGMTLEADVIQDRRAIWEWLLEPVIAVGQRWKVSSSELAGASPEDDRQSR